MQNQNNAIADDVTKNLPSTLDGWERLLAGYFLAIGIDGDASDIHSFEVTRDTLAIACGADATQLEEVETAFRKALVNDPLLVDMLQIGPQRRPTSELPQCFAHLTLTLFIDGLLDGKYSSKGAFRKKLSDWLNINRVFVNLKGIAAMWEKLVTWLDHRAATGASFRRLVLPDPGTWNHIGYTRRLSFPNRHDIRMVESVLQRCSDLDNPAAMLNAFRSLLANDGTSIGLRDAYEDFRLSYFARRRALAEHRFWRLITRVHASMDKRISSEVIIELTFNENAEMEFRASLQGGTEMRSHASLTAALATDGIVPSINLGPAINRGILFFRQMGMGRWQAEPDLARCHDHVYVALAVKHKTAMGQRLGLLVGDAGWLISTKPESVNFVSTALAQARLLAGTGERIFRPAIANGIRVQGAWLGLPRFLPTIEADASEVAVFSDTTGAPTVEVVSVNGTLQLISDVPLTCVYTVEPERRNRELSAAWRLRMPFVDRALPHLKLEGARHHLPRLIDWAGVERDLVRCDEGESLDWELGDARMENLLEAIYAEGGSGWDEADLISLVRRASPEIEINPWPMLRLLQDAGIIEPRLRQGWKGRVWTLVVPRIVKANHGNEELALAEGALCAQLLDDFNLAVQGLRGHCFRRQGTKPWSAPVVGAVGVSAAELAERLGWPLALEVDTASAAPLAFSSTARHAEHYRVASTWCWSTKRFVSDGAIEGAIRLSRRSHQNSTDHDVYRVEHAGNLFNFLSRNAAIMAAHAMAAVPLFEFTGDRIERLSREGSLPDLLSATLRRRRLRAAEMEGQQYVYPASEVDARWLISLLPGCIIGVTTTDQPSPGSILSMTRRSGGSMRPQWRGNRLVL